VHPIKVMTNVEQYADKKTKLTFYLIGS